MACKWLVRRAVRQTRPSRLHNQYTHAPTTVANIDCRRALSEPAQELRGYSIIGTNSNITPTADYYSKHHIGRASYNVSFVRIVPLPASGSVCKKTLVAFASLALSPDVLGPVDSVFLDATSGRFQVSSPSLRFRRLLKKFCSIWCRVGLGALPRIGHVGATVCFPPPRLQSVALILPPCISASARSTIGSEKDH